jgi:flagellar basal-body rod protein FlgB
VLFDVTQLALQRAMEGSGLRQQALADNIANSNTPGYRRHDVDFHDALAGALQSGNPTAALSSTPLTVTQDPSAPLSADGNSVDIDAESAKLAANGLEYEQLAGAMKTRMEILRAAMGLS